MTKRASYRDGILWIAENDEPEELDVYTVEGFISTQLLADLFGKTPDHVARGVVNKRRSLLRSRKWEHENSGVVNP